MAVLAGGMFPKAIIIPVLVSKQKDQKIIPQSGTHASLLPTTRKW
jgi:hypothetical protein